MTDWEVPPQLLDCHPTAPESPFFTHLLQHTSNRATGSEQWEERAQKNITHANQTQQKQHGPFQDLLHIHLWSPDLLQCTASQSEDTCWIWATSLKPISRPKWTVSRFIPINIVCLFVFLYFFLHIYKKKMTQTFNSSLFNPQPQTVSG